MTDALVKWQVNGGYRTGRKVLDLDGFTVSCVKAVATDVERWEPEN